MDCLLNITTTYPIWILLFCLLAGALVAFILYHQNRKYELSNQTSWLLGSLRAIVVAFIAFLLLNPLIKSQKRFTEKPVIVFLQDNSASVQTGTDSAFIQSEYLQAISALEENLSENYDVEMFSFDDHLASPPNMNFQGAITNLSAVLDEVETRFAYRNVGAMIIASDGIYNRGSNPVYAADGLAFPIYTIALGDTSLQHDLILKKISFNRIAYLGNEFPMEITVQAAKCQGQESRLTIQKEGEVLYSKVVQITNDNFLFKESVLLKANEKGLQRYRIELSPVNEEVSLANNKQDVFIDILEGKQKILILANAPHPDVSAIKQAILTNKNYAVENYPIDKFDQSVAAYNLVVLHGLPTLEHSISTILDDLREKQIPTLHVLTKRTYLKRFNDQPTGVSIRDENLIYNESQPIVNPSFSLFTMGEKTLSLLAGVPPLVSPYGMISVQPSATPMLFQSIGTIETEEPLIVLNETANVKSGVILGEGIWRWRMKSWALTGTHQPFDQLINKMVQFLSLKVDKRFFRVIHENNFSENQPVEFEAQVYNEIYELVNEAEVKIVISDDTGNEYPFVFNKTSNAYHLNAGRLPAGSYHYHASVQMGEKLLTDNGTFTVSPLNIELVNTVADHNLLFNLAKSKGGEMFYPNQLENLKDAVLSREDIKTISYRQDRYSELLNLPWLLGLLLFLISIEWFVRKRAGAY